MAPAWLSQKLMSRGEPARGGGWVARAQHLLEGGRDCVEQGYLLLPIALRTYFQGRDPATAHAIFTRAAEMRAIAARERAPYASTAKSTLTSGVATATVP